MQDSSTFTLFLPIALVVIMLGLGLSLTVRDFRHVLAAPRALVWALVCRLAVLPAVCLAIAYAFGLEPALAVGMMLLAASPGGASSNLYSHLAGGDVALNVTLTAINSVLAIVTLPIIVNLSLANFMGEGQAIPLQVGKMLQVFVVVVVPMLIGMWLRGMLPRLADGLARPVKILSVLFLVVVVTGALIKEWETFKTWAPVIGLAALLFNVASLAIAYAGARLVGIDRRQAITVAMEIGIRNAALAIAMALSPMLLDNATMAMPAALYGLVAYVTAAAFLYLLKRAGAVANPQSAPAIVG